MKLLPGLGNAVPYVGTTRTPIVKLHIMHFENVCILIKRGIAIANGSNLAQVHRHECLDTSKTFILLYMA